MAFTNKKREKEYRKQWRKENSGEMEEYMKKWREDNKDYLKEHRKKYYQDNIEKMLKNNKEYRKNNKEHCKKYNKDYWEKNREKLLKNKQIYGKSEKRKLYYRRYFKTEKGRANSQRGHIKRRAREIEIINTLTSQEWLDILEEYNYRCAYCGIEFDCENLPTKDHILPVSKGGHNTKNNVIPACKSCNSKKYNKLDYNALGV